MNGLTALAWPAKLLAGLVALISRIDHNLASMAPESATLKLLAASPDPGIPYVLLAGNTSMIAPEAAEIEGTLERLVTALSGRNLLYRTTALAFLSKPNDMAVSVASIGGLPRYWATRARLVEVPSDHISYFLTEASLRVLEECVSG